MDRKDSRLVKSLGLPESASSLGIEARLEVDLGISQREASSY